MVLGRISGREGWCHGGGGARPSVRSVAAGAASGEVYSQLEWRGELGCKTIEFAEKEARLESRDWACAQRDPIPWGRLSRHFASQKKRRSWARDWLATGGPFGNRSVPMHQRAALAHLWLSGRPLRGMLVCLRQIALWHDDDLVH